MGTKVLRLLGLTAKMRKVAVGTYRVEQLVRNKKCKLIFLSKESSEKTAEYFKKINPEIIIVKDYSSADLCYWTASCNKHVFSILSREMETAIIKEVTS